MAVVNVQGWSGQLTNYNGNNIGLTTLKSDGYTFEVFFYIEDLYIYGKQCSKHYRLQDYIDIDTLIHFDAKRFSKPVYEYGYNVWYQATSVWIGEKPQFDESDDESYSSEESCDEYDIPDVTCQSGEVVYFANKNTAVLKSTIDNNNVSSLVALERCRFYFCYDDGDFNQPEILSADIKIGDWVQFEAFFLDPSHPSGVTYRVGLGWQGFRPDMDLNRPTHLLHLPQNPICF